MSSDRFFRYDPPELKSCAERLIGELGEARSALARAADADTWTELALDWLAAQASPRARVDSIAARPHLTAEIYSIYAFARPRASSRECPWAMSHSTYPQFELTPHGYAYWEQAFERERLEILLAVACEWGSGRAAARYGRILSAASDLASIDARSKIVLFASDGEEERRKITDGLSRLRVAAWDSRPWLWIDLAWRADWDAHPPAASLLEG